MADLITEERLRQLTKEIKAKPRSVWAIPWEVLDALIAERKERKRIDGRLGEMLTLVHKISQESISEEEAKELRGQIAALIAEVGTLKGEKRALQEALEATPVPVALDRTVKISTEPNCPCGRPSRWVSGWCGECDGEGITSRTDILILK